MQKFLEFSRACKSKFKEKSFEGRRGEGNVKIPGIVQDGWDPPVFWCMAYSSVAGIPCHALCGSINPEGFTGAKLPLWAAQPHVTSYLPTSIPRFTSGPIPIFHVFQAFISERCWWNHEDSGKTEKHARSIQLSINIDQTWKETLM